MTKSSATIVVIIISQPDSQQRMTSSNSSRELWSRCHPIPCHAAANATKYYIARGCDRLTQFLSPQWIIYYLSKSVLLANKSVTLSTHHQAEECNTIISRTSNLSRPIIIVSNSMVTMRSRLHQTEIPIRNTEGKKFTRSLSASPEAAALWKLLLRGPISLLREGVGRGVFIATRPIDKRSS